MLVCAYFYGNKISSGLPYDFSYMAFFMCKTFWTSDFFSNLATVKWQELLYISNLYLPITRILSWYTLQLHSPLRTMLIITEN